MSKYKTKIAVVCGGVSEEREVSLRSGREVYRHLPGEKYRKALIEITPDGRWLPRAFEQVDFLEPNRPLLVRPRRETTRSDLRKFDLVFLTLHGRGGEDGRVQTLLESVGVPYTGSSAASCALTMDKETAARKLRSAGKIPVPRFVRLDIRRRENALAAAREMGCPLVIKPADSGSSIGISIVNDPRELPTAIEKAAEFSEKILAQEYISGRELSCAVLGNSTCGIRSLPPVEIIVEKDFFDYRAKYLSKQTREICPAELSAEMTEKIRSLAEEAHRFFDCDGLTRSDFILREGRFYFLEINTCPGLTARSLCPREALAAGMTPADLFAEIIDLALEKKAGDNRPRTN